MNTALKVADRKLVNTKIVCEVCDKKFECFADSKEKCWCMDLPKYRLSSKFKNCICFNCLKPQSLLTR
jgi:hypothetical protein